jgi:hypothetical protein
MACCRMSLERILGTCNIPAALIIPSLWFWNTTGTVVGKKPQNCWKVLWVPKGPKWTCWKGRKPTARHLGPLDKHLGKQGCKCRLHDHKIFNSRENRPINIRPSVLFMFNRIQICIVICCQFIIRYLPVVICNLASSFKFTFVRFCSVVLGFVFCSFCHSVSTDYSIIQCYFLFW